MRSAVQHARRAGGHFKPRADTGLEPLHNEVIRGNAAALEELLDRLRPALRRQLRRTFPTIPDHVVTDAVQDAMADYGLNPSSFDRTRGCAVDRFLYVAAWRNTADSVDSETGRRAGEPAQILSPARASGTGHNWTRTRRFRGLLNIAVSDRERRPLRLWLDGERRLELLAAALGLSYLPVREARQEIRRFKDRIFKRFAEWISRTGAHPANDLPPVR